LNSAKIAISKLSLNAREKEIAAELLALLEALEHQEKRRRSLWTRLTTPDYLPVMVERVRILVELVTGG
jgi:Trp operon repressor